MFTVNPGYGIVVVRGPAYRVSVGESRVAIVLRLPERARTPKESIVYFKTGKKIEDDEE